MDTTYDTATKTLAFSATVGLYPAYEAYAQLNNGPTVTLFRESPTAGTAWGLYEFGTGLGSKQLKGQVKLQ